MEAGARLAFELRRQISYQSHDQIDRPEIQTNMTKLLADEALQVVAARRQAAETLADDEPDPGAAVFIVALPQMDA